MRLRSTFVYGALLAIWLLVAGWQVLEHVRVERAARAAILNRTREISNTLGLLVRAQSFFGIITKERLVGELNELVKSNEFHEFHPASIELLNVSNEVVAAAGLALDPQIDRKLQGGQYWNDREHTLTMMTLLDLGTNIVLSASEPLSTNRPPPRSGTNSLTAFPSNSVPPLAVSTTNLSGAGASNVVDSTVSTNRPPRRRNFGRRGREAGNEPFERPSWMKEDEFKFLTDKKGVHGVILALSTPSLGPTLSHDAWLRVFIGLLAGISALGYAFVWRNFMKTSELQIRLVRASELNSHLKEMNLAAAGLAHETRNPLNIIRGLAQIISRQQDASDEVRGKSRDILNETDRVTAQLNEFINYSRPREVRRAAVNLGAVVADVLRALNFDIEEKKVLVSSEVESVMIEADEQLFRQALFNLVLNGVQAVPEGGELQVRTVKAGAAEIVLEVADNGPGVPLENRTEIFRPYFTTHTEGTGLGLAVVQQIIQAHGWEIACSANEPRGALFRITHIKAMAGSHAA